MVDLLSKFCNGKFYPSKVPVLRVKLSFVMVGGEQERERERERERLCKNLRRTLCPSHLGHFYDVIFLQRFLGATVLYTVHNLRNQDEFHCQFRKKESCCQTYLVYAPGRVWYIKNIATSGFDRKHRSRYEVEQDCTGFYTVYLPRLQPPFLRGQHFSKCAMLM